MPHFWSVAYLEFLNYYKEKEMETINSIIGNNEVEVQIRLKHLSNELRAKLIGLDAKYGKLSRKYLNSKFSAESLAKDVAEIEASDLTDKEKEKKISEAFDSHERYQIETFALLDKKNRETLELISFSPNGEYGNEEFWTNADTGKITEIIVNFRTKYRFWE